MKGLFFAFGLVAALALAMWLELKQSERRVEEQAKAELAEVLLPVAPRQVQKVRWRNHERGESEVEVERTPEGWQMRAPYLGPAAGPRIEDLIETATKLKKAVKLTGVDPRKAGFEAGFDAYVELEGEFGKTRLEIGAPLPHREYGNALRIRRLGFPAPSPTQAELFSFPPTIFNAINDYAEHFRDLALAPCPVDRMISIRVLPLNEPARLELRRDPARGWIALEPFQGELDPELMDRLVSRLASLSFLREAGEGRSATAEYGFEPPRFQLEFGDGAAQQTALELGVSESELEGMTTGAAAARFARLPGDIRVRTVSEEALEPLLGPPNDPTRGWADLRKRDLGVSGSAPLARLERKGSLTRGASGTLELEVASAFRLERRGLQLVDGSSAVVEAASATRWIDALRTLRAEGFARRPTASTGATAMLSAAFDDERSITLLLSAPDAEGRVFVDFGDPWLVARLAPEVALQLFRPLASWH